MNFFCFLLSSESFIAHNLGTAGPIQVGFSAKCTCTNENFNQIKKEMKVPHVRLPTGSPRSHYNNLIIIIIIIIIMLLLLLLAKKYFYGLINIVTVAFDRQNMYSLNDGVCRCNSVLTHHMTCLLVLYKFCTTPFYI